MPWTEANFRRDTDNPSIGTASVTFTADDGSTFTHADRVDEKNGLGEFVQTAKNRLAAQQKKSAEVSEINAKILSALNR